MVGFDRLIALQKPWLIMVVFLIAITGLVVIRSYPHGISRFIVAGNLCAVQEKVPVNIFVGNGFGFDGQFFFRFALDPFNFKKAAYGITLDDPGYRGQRIGYPLLCYLWSFARPQWVPYTMVLVNVLGLMGIFALIFFWARRYDALPWAMIFVFVLGGLWLTFSRNCADILSLFFVLMAWFLYEKLHLFWCACFCFLAAFVKETSLIATLPIAFYQGVRWFNRREKFYNVFIFMIPVLSILTWKLYIETQTGLISHSIDSQFNFPFFGLFMGLRVGLHSIFSDPTPNNAVVFIFWLASVIWFIWFMKIVVYSQIRSKMIETPLHFILMMTFVFWLMLMVLFSQAIWQDIWGFMRVTLEAQVAGVLLIILSQKKPGITFRVFSILLGLGIFIRCCIFI